MSNSLEIRNDGLVVIFVGPSGVGKNTISNMVMERDQQVRYFVTATTREPRSFEQEGEDYYFLDQAEFERRLDNDEFLEHSRHYGNYYGTLKQELLSKIAAGFDPHTDITWSGARAVREFLPNNTIVFCIAPPSADALHERMAQRKKDSGELDENQRMRLEKTLDDMHHFHDEGYIFTNDDMKGSTLADYDYVAVNRDLEATVQFILDAIRLERQKRRL